MSYEPLVAVDLFCGAGGFSTGFALACEDLDRELGVDVDLHAINHWEPAIETHETNHPWAEHYHAKIEELHPPDVVEPGSVDLLVGGPECVHFSRARGGKPVKEQKRASAWHVLDWVEKLRPDAVLLENVPPFRDWGPIVDGQPTRDGSIFRQWVQMFEALGYTVVRNGEDEYGVVLNAADYGDPTRRDRLFIMASKSHRPTPPEPTHAEDPGPDDDRDPWRTAAEIIDWTDPGTSLWTRDLENARVQPLSENTMARIAEGIRRHCDGALGPLADALAEIGPDELERMRERRVVDLEYADVVADAVDEPFLVRCPGGGAVLADPDSFVLRQQDGAYPPHVGEEPLPTIATGGAFGLVTPAAGPLIKPRNGAQRGLHSNPLYPAAEAPLHTVTASNHDGHLVTPQLIHYSHGGSTRDCTRPMPTIATERGGAFGLATPYLVEYYGNGGSQPVDEPLPTATSRDRFALVVPEAWPWGLDVRYRMLQPKELARAQGFPRDYEICGDTKKAVTEQIGNAVPVHTATALCKHILAIERPSLTTFGGGIQADPDADVPEYDEVISDD